MSSISKTFYAVIAGVGAGTGRSVALRFARAYPVVLLSRRPESYNPVVDEIRQQGGEALGICTDLTNPDSVKAAFETIKRELPGRQLAAAICESRSTTDL